MAQNDGKWEAMWLNTKDEFKDVTGSKKPETKRLGGLIKSKKSNVAKKLRDVDSVYKVYQAAVTGVMTRKVDEPTALKALNKFGISVKDAFKEIDSYEDTLEQEINALKEKDEKTLRYRGLKTMVRRLEEIKAEVTKGQQSLFNTLNANREMIRREDAKEEKMSVEDSLAANDPVIVKSIKAGAAKELAFVAQCKALLKKGGAEDLSLVQKYYKSKMQTAARDLTQPINNGVKRLKMVLPRNVSDANDIFLARNDGKANIDGKDLRGIAAEIKTLSQAGKAIAIWAKSL